MIPLTLFPLICRPWGAQESASSASLQILTLRRVFLTAPSKRTLDNEDDGGNDEARILLNFDQIAWTVSYLLIEGRHQSSHHSLQEITKQHDETHNECSQWFPIQASCSPKRLSVSEAVPPEPTQGSEGSVG